VLAQAIGDLLPLGLGVAVSPVPIIAIILMLGTPRAHANGLAFALGWVLGLSVASAVLVSILSTQSTADSGGPATWTSVLKLLLGLALVVFAVRGWMRRPPPGVDPPLPRWMQAVDSFTAGRSLALGAALAAVNPKNLALAIGAATVVAEAQLTRSEDVAAVAVFVVIGSATIVAPLVVYLAAGERAPAILGGIKAWMVEHNLAIMTILLLVLGVKLAGDAISGLGS
jgi:threonine/homoserine/homoserine lactone efflux protein